MAKRRRNENNIVDSILTMLVSLIGWIIIIFFRLMCFIYDVISFYTSGYKQKSGTSFFKTYFNKGLYGEFCLYRKVCRLFGKAFVLTNIYLDSINTETTEIDVLSISNKGIYVYEMKNYSGFIYGSETDKQWTQVLNKWTKNKFYNPLRQNYAHTKAIEKFLDVCEQQIFPIVVFSNRSKLSKISITKDQNVFQYRDAIRFVKNKEKYHLNQITDKQKETYLVKLLSRTKMSDEFKEKHIEEIKMLREKKG